MRLEKGLNLITDLVQIKMLIRAIIYQRCVDSDSELGRECFAAFTAAAHGRPLAVAPYEHNFMYLFVKLVEGRVSSFGYRYLFRSYMSFVQVTMDMKEYDH